MSGRGVLQREAVQDFQQMERDSGAKIDGKLRWRDKTAATCGALCGCKAEGFSGGAGFGPVARFPEYRLISIGRQVAPPVAGPR